MKLRKIERRTRALGADTSLIGGLWLCLERLGAAVGVSDWFVDVVLVEDCEMAALNERYREVSGVTDVLSFSYLEFAGSGEPDLRRGERCAARDLWRADLPSELPAGEAIGEVVLAPAFIAQCCQAREWSLSAEFQLLVVHGCLHLLGWDHPDDSATASMRSCEARILATEGISHPVRQVG